MFTITPGDSAHAAGAPAVASDHLQERLAEAACYAVLRRVAPALRHEVAGFMQPVGMLMMVLQRRVQMREPDLQVIAKNVTSVSTLTKEATTACMNAMGWIAPREGSGVSLRGGVDEAIKLLTMELSAKGLEVVSDLPDDSTEISQSVFRSLLMGAFLAFCDQHSVGGTLHVSIEAGTRNDGLARRLMLRMLPGSAARSPVPPDAVRKFRNIDWLDVEAMAGSFGVSMVRGEGWIALELPDAH
jgi:hypothetical protein